MSFEDAAPNGPQTITVWVLTHRGAILQATVNVTRQCAPGLASLTLEAAEVLGGGVVGGQVTLESPATAGGAAVGLSSSNPAAASVPTSVTVPEGETSASFSVTTSAVALPTQVEVTGTSGGLTRTATLLLDSYRVVGLSLDPASILGGTASSGTVSLNAPAPAGGIAVALTSSHPTVASVPSSVDRVCGRLHGDVRRHDHHRRRPDDVEITAGAGGSTATATLTVGPLTVAALDLAPQTVLGGTPAQGTVTLNGPAPAGGFTVTLASGNPAATVPSTVTVGAGLSSATFTVTTSVVPAPLTAEISATAGGVRPDREPDRGLVPRDRAGPASPPASSAERRAPAP